MAYTPKQYTFTPGAVILSSEHNRNFDDIYNDYNGNITNYNIAPNANIVDTKLYPIATYGKVIGSAIASFATVYSAAGYIPAINLASGTTGTNVYLRGDGTWVGSSTASGVAVLDSGGLVPSATLATGSADSLKVLTGAQTWVGLSGVGGLQKVFFGAVGTTSWICPAGVTVAFITMIAGGGGGGSAHAGTKVGVAGGGAGQWVNRMPVTVAVGTTYGVGVGTGGFVNGGTSSFNIYWVAGGRTSASNDVGNFAGSGGGYDYSGSVGLLGFSGGYAITAGMAGTISAGGLGAASPFGMGGSCGVASTGYGTGGAGAGTDSAPTSQPGMQGFVLIEY